MLTILALVVGGLAGATTAWQYAARKRSDRVILSAVLGHLSTIEAATARLDAKVGDFEALVAAQSEKMEVLAAENRELHRRIASEEARCEECVNFSTGG